VVIVMVIFCLDLQAWALSDGDRWPYT